MTQRILSRTRLISTTAGALAAAVLITSAYTVTAPEDSPHVQTVAERTVSSNVSVNLGSSSVRDVQAVYNRAINQIRVRAGDGTLREGIIRERRWTDYFAVHLQANFNEPQLDLVINAQNMYVVGYYNHANNVYTRMEGPTDVIPGATVRTDFLRQADYPYLQRAGNFNRAGQDIGISAIRGAIHTLLSPNANLAASARAITLLTQAFAEGARFDYISANIADALGRGAMWRVDNAAITFETNWQTISNRVRDALASASQFYFDNNGWAIRGLEAIAAQLAIAYMDPRWRETN